MKLYDDGYSKCPCYWGTTPASLVQEAVEYLKNKRNGELLKAIDLGCGEGKNTSHVAKNGFVIVGIDQSEYAIEHAKTNYLDSQAIFLIGDMKKIFAPKESFDLVISTGSVHCLETEQEVQQMIQKMIQIVKKDGLIVFSSFNDRDNNFSGHPKDFNPIMLPHRFFIEQFSELNIVHESDKDLEDIHPDNNIPHTHSITRILAMKK